MQDCNPTHTPLPAGFTTSAQTNTPDVDPTSYRSLIGKLSFLTTTRPDLIFAVDLLSRYNYAPQMAHLLAAKQILRYVRGTTSQGLFYPRSDTFTLIGYSDADWGGDLDQRKSTGAYIFTINNTPVTWNTKKQTCIALSSTESEFRSLVEATKEARWIQFLFQELGFDRKKPIQLMCDNQSAIKISKNPQFHSKTKNFEIHLNFVRDMVERGFVTKMIANRPTCLQKL